MISKKNFQNQKIFFMYVFEISKKSMMSLCNLTKNYNQLFIRINQISFQQQILQKMMDVYPNQQADEEVYPTHQNSDSKMLSRSLSKSGKAKQIKKKNKSKTKTSKVKRILPLPVQKSSPTMTPFSIFEPDQQKYKRLEIYFKDDIEHYYPVSLEPEQIRHLYNRVNQNFICLGDIVRGDVRNVWKNTSIFEAQLIAYFQLIQKCKQFQNSYNLIGDRDKHKFYCVFEAVNQNVIWEVSPLQAHLLQKRKKFADLFLNQAEANEQSSGKTSEMTQEIIFLSKNLYQLSAKLKKNIIRIQQNFNTCITTKAESLVEDNYSSYLICKLLIDAFQPKEIDYFNYFKNNQRLQQGYEEQSKPIMDVRQYQQYLKKKKSKKVKKSRYILHSACLGCFSGITQQYNQFIHCQECFARFHKICYTPKEDGLCQMCYWKKNNTSSRLRVSQCEICPNKGLISTPLNNDESVSFSHRRYIHIFCLLIHNLWKVQNKKLKYDPSHTHQFIQQRKCNICQTPTHYLFKCERCGNEAHGSCAFLAGWQFQGTIDDGKVKVIIRCCGVDLETNSKNRKFITNYKKGAFAHPS